jgi:hypothetical protein
MSWYKMHRGWQSHEAFADEPFTEREAWEWLIAEASYDGKKPFNVSGEPVILPRGKLSFSLSYMARAWQWEKSRADRYVKRIAKWGLIETQSERGQTVITICEYEKFQGNQNEDETQGGREQDAERDAERTNFKKDKEIKEERGASAEPPCPEISKPPKPKGARLTPDWVLPADWGLWALQEGLTRQQVLTEEESFRDYWIAKPGKDGVKLDWQATWRNWIRKAKEYGRGKEFQGRQ